jgi:hypothetical protein
MAATNFTPISLYYSTTASAAPSAGNLVAGELALNTLDEKLYFKNSAGVVKLLASNAVTAPVTTISFGSTGLTPSTATSGAVTVAGTLATANGGTNLTSFTSGGAVYATSTSALTTGTLPIASGGTGQTTASAAFNALSPITTTGDLILGNGTNSATRLGIGANGYLLTSNGTTASWQAAPAGGVTTFSAGTTGLTPSTATGGAITLAGTLAVANGGTGITSFGTGVATWLGTPTSANLISVVSDETGSGSLVFATSPTLVTPILGTPTSGTLSNCTVDGTSSVGFRNIPQNTQSGNYTLVLTDSGKHIFHDLGEGAATYTIPANASVAFPIGTAITFINMAASVVSIAITSDTLRLSSAGTTGTRSLAQYGSATCIKVSLTVWLISGSGLT